MKNYKFLRTNPVAKFYYQGDHTHPVRRTVVIIENGVETFTGYELREGSKVREFKHAPIKTYRKDRIARVAQIDNRRALRREATEAVLNRSTLSRLSLQELVRNGA